MWLELLRVVQWHIMQLKSNLHVFALTCYLENCFYFLIKSRKNNHTLNFLKRPLNLAASITKQITFSSQSTQI